MRRALAVILATVACGDNSRTCGEGTNDLDNDGLCEADVGGSGVCGPGTRVDPVTMECVVDPSACTGGTVLVDGRCQDPAAGLDIDLEEGPEPNGFETDAVPAGIITLGATPFVLHGCIVPTSVADFDVYQLAVTAPTLVEISADGVEGLAAGFSVTSTVGALATWRRFGVNLAGDMSKRQVLLPAAGTYRIALADTRTLLPQITGGSGAPPAGNAQSCYYVTIEAQSPMRAPLQTTNTGTIGEDLAFFTASGLSSSTQITATIMSPHAQAAIVVLDGTTLRAFDDDGTLTFDGTGMPTVVLDFVFHYALSASPYRLTVP